MARKYNTLRKHIAPVEGTQFDVHFNVNSFVPSGSALTNKWSSLTNRCVMRLLKFKHIADEMFISVLTAVPRMTCCT